jgi:toxin-antitoxin system PIN domain toxin
VFVVDTNILVYAVNRDDSAHEPCRTALERWRNQPEVWFLTWGICFEFLRVVTHPRILPSPVRANEAWRFLNALLQSPGLELLIPSARYADVAAEIMRERPTLAGNDMRDVEIAALMRDQGVKTIYTRDTGFHRFRFLEPIDPTVTGRGGLHEG